MAAIPRTSHEAAGVEVAEWPRTAAVVEHIAVSAHMAVADTVAAAARIAHLTEVVVVRSIAAVAVRTAVAVVDTADTTFLGSQKLSFCLGKDAL